MQIFGYQPYYRFGGPAKSDPLREELTDEEAERRIELFFNEIRIYFLDIEATFERHDKGGLTIKAPISQRDCDERVKRCLNNLDLLANKFAI